MADFAARFGYGGVAGGGLSLKTKGNWLLASRYQFIYGNRVKEDSILRHLTTTEGYVLDKDAQPVGVLLLQRGFSATVEGGRLFKLGKNPNSGVAVCAGVGWLQHKIRIQEDFAEVPGLEGDYRRGYDRLSSGLAAVQSLGYQHMGHNKLINFYAGIELHEGFTRGRRSIDFDTGLPGTAARFDAYAAAVVRWKIPLSRPKPKDFYFY